MSNSPLVNYTKISPNKSVMTNKVNTHIVKSNGLDLVNFILKEKFYE